jgi:fluoroquinolone transport system permease protein
MTSTIPAHRARPVDHPGQWPLAVGARYTLRAMRWQALVAGAALGSAVIGLSHLSEGGLLGSVHLGIVFATVAIAIGAAFILDDPAATTLAAVPVTLRLRTALRLTLGLLLLALSLAAFAVLAWEALTHLAMAGQAIGLASVGIAGSVLAGRLAGWQRPGTGGAAAVTAAVVADMLGLLPADALLTGGASVTHTTATITTWTVLLGSALLVTGWATTDPARHPTATRSTARRRERSFG